MPINSALAHKTWVRYAWARDNGHSAYVQKAERWNGQEIQPHRSNDMDRKSSGH